jgi:curved DNA-binding protein CbpA
MNFYSILVTTCLYGLINISLASSQKDYYKSLGLRKGASARDIKKAFRKLALKYHPDKSSEPGAEDRFREIAEAYEVLRDPEKRAQYDQMGHKTFSRDSGFKPGNFDFQDLFKDFDDLFKEFGDMEGHFKQHFGNHKMHHDAAGGNFQFGQDIKFEDLFQDSPFLHMNEYDMFGHDMEDIGRVNLKGGRRSEQACRTVTQRIGSTVTTYTQCS